MWDQGLDSHVFHLRPGRSLMQCSLEPVQPSLIALGLGLDATVRKVAHEATQTLACGGVPREEPKADALHAARDQIPSRYDHVAALLPSRPGYAR